MDNREEPVAVPCLVLQVTPDSPLHLGPIEEDAAE